MNVSQVGALGQAWGSPSLSDFAISLSTTPSTANAGNLTGNRMFFSNDYMVSNRRAKLTACADKALSRFIVVAIMFLR
jgi:hypothetical protein